MNRRQINDALVEWIRRTVKEQYAGHIALVVMYGSHLNGTANDRSDVDCYFIPKSDRGFEFAQTFILEGVGYDLYPVSWERLEAIADLGSAMAPLLGDVKILYCDGPEDEARFAALARRLGKNLADEEYSARVAVCRCREAGACCARLLQAELPGQIWSLAGCGIMMLADAVAVYHHDYFHFGLKRQYEDLCSNFSGLPEAISRLYAEVVAAADPNQARERTLALYGAVCAHIGCSPELPEVQPEPSELVKPDVQALAGLYEEISSTFQKIYVSCEKGNAILGFLSAVCLQRELDFAEILGAPRTDLLKGFSHSDLPALAERVRRAEEELVAHIQNGGAKLHCYESFADFVRERGER